MAKAGYTGEQPVRVAREESYPGAWTSPEQYAERKANTWSLSPVYEIERSLRFNSADSAYLSRTPASAGNRKTWTWAGWVKRSQLGVRQTVFDGGGATSGLVFEFSAADKLELYTWGGISPGVDVLSTPVFRDTAAWFHLLVAFDTTQAVPGTYKLYVNGLQINSFDLTDYPAQNIDYPVNSAAIHSIGRRSNSQFYFSGYLADIYFIDGQALTPTSFGKFDDNGVWQPKAYTGTYPGNSFHLDFSDNSTAAALGTDASGNGNTWAVNNISTSTGGPTSVASASGALPILNTSDTYGTIASGGIRSDSLAANVQLCLPFDGGSTTDVSPTGRVSSPRTGTVSNVSSNSISKLYGSSARFASGSINYGIVSAAAVNSTNNHTFEGWFRVDDVTLTRALFSWYNYEDGWVEQGWQIRIASSKVVVRNTTAGNEIFSKSIASNTWYHFAVTFQGVACKLYLDGELQSSTSNFGTPGNTSNRLTVGSSFYYGSVQDPITGYFQDFRWYDYVKYTTSFNPPSATINGGIAAGNDSLVDTPTSYGTDTGVGSEVRGNYCTLNPLDKGSGPTLANGNLDVTGTAGVVRGTMFMPSGKWYFEGTLTALGNSGNNTPRFGVANAAEPIATSDAGSSNNVATIICSPNATFGGRGIRGGTTVGTGNPFAVGDVAMVAYDADTGNIWFGKNGTWINSGNPATGASPTFTGLTAPYAPLAQTDPAGFYCNFGQRPFAYPAPSGFKALCTQNLPTPTITNGATAMDVKLYTGNGSTQTISALGFSPDLVWLKARNLGATDHKLTDSVRGATQELASNSTASENTNSNGLTAFTSDGFTVGSGTAYNSLGNTFVAWNWDAGSSTVTNTSGTISSQVRANASAGFSVVTYTGTGVNATVGHGLGVAPEFLIIKKRSANDSWRVYHRSITASNFLSLDLTDASTSSSVYWNSTAPTSTVFSLGTNGSVNGSSSTFVGYCWAPVAGYSSFGSYVGNGSADGPFVYTGFRPRWIMFKATYLGANTDWTIWDTARDAFNVTSNYIRPNLSSAEQSIGYGDILSNGFKFRYTDGNNNALGQTYIYAAFAEAPFQYARAR